MTGGVKPSRGVGTARGRARAVLALFRPARTPMVAMIAGTAAFSSGAGLTRTLLIGIGGLLLAAGGFSLDFYADRRLDSVGPRAANRRNPLATGELHPSTGLALSMCSLGAGVVLCALASLRSLVPAAVVVLIVGGLAFHWFERPLARAFTLGALQALYVGIGALAGRPGIRAILLAALFFLAMFGGRGMIDIRDFPLDSRTAVQTLPKRFGVRRTAVLTAVCLHLAFAVSVALYFLGSMSRVYLLLDLLFVLIGLGCAWWFALRPSAALARVLTMVFMMGEGTLICLAVILGSL
jgi:4-hydroxybenzoate polyprenyltransferase